METAIPRGLNTVGIQRQGLPTEASEALKESYKFCLKKKQIKGSAKRNYFKIQRH